ncbi:hypothetical protein RRG08_016683 [Elysia crispata]|uniref:Uncharacterized protein n=1 Tax=Elysia crispata TaxID=231223 RepID=A0AAE1AIY9_9GAST|nr:hypothetical protein RRG08_016683 [Elysia crispata]
MLQNALFDLRSSGVMHTLATHSASVTSLHINVSYQPGFKDMGGQCKIMTKQNQHPESSIYEYVWYHVMKITRPGVQAFVAPVHHLHLNSFQTGKVLRRLYYTDHFPEPVRHFPKLC